MSSLTLADFGQIALWAAIVAGVLSVALFRMTRSARSLLTASVVASLASTAALVIALISNDFSIDYVVSTTSRGTPWPYRLAALWGGMDGSMLLYATLILTIGAIGLRVNRGGQVSRVVVGLVGTGLLLLTATLTNPFAVLDVPAVDGQGLLAILQHPAMIYHPPVLYLGLVSLVVPFALTTERVVEKRIDLEWATTVRRALLVSWTLLTLGMLFGANWAYVELGWGGFWAWDPVENTALMPWLAITVFLHTSVLQRRDGRATRFNVFLALFAFALSVAGVYLTRSGVTGSIHAFAENPVIGRILLTSALVTAIWSVSAAAMSPRGARWERVDIARDSWLAASGVLVSAVLVFVVAGTVYPAFAQVFLGQSLSIDSTYFVTTVGPVTVLIVLALGLSLRTRWDAAGISMRALIVYLLGVSSLVLIVGLVASQGTVLAAVLVGSASVAGLFLLRDLIVRRPMRRLAPYLAHLGLATVVLASAGSAFGSDFSGSMSSGDVVEVGPKTVRLLGIETGEADRYQYVRARFEIGLEDVAEPEIRAYEEQATPVAEPVLLSSPLSDTIVAISRVTQDLESVDVTVFVKPLVWWVWWGALLVAIAGVVALAGRSGGVAGQRQLATEAPQREETTTGTSSP